MEQLARQVSSLSTGMDCQSLRHTLRTTAAAAASLLAARAFGLPEAHWAVITTVVVMQSTLGAAWDVSWHRLAGTLIGGVTATMLIKIVTPGLLPFSAGMLAMGPLCAWLRLGNGGYRFAGITLAVIMLPHQSAPIWTFALHRLLEVTVGIVVGMAVTAIWRERASPGVALPPTEHGPSTLVPSLPCGTHPPRSPA